ncbi:MAG: hypothetical protein M1835_000601, partial [Candelina submexicana]
PRAIELIIILSIAPVPAKGKNSVLNIHITNPYDKPVYLLKWNTVLENSIGLVSSLLFSAKSVESYFAPVARFRTFINYRKASPSHFVRIEPEETFTKTINIDENYLVARDTTSRLQLDERCRGFLFEGDLGADPIERADVMYLPVVELKPPDIEIDLYYNVRTELDTSKGMKKRAVPLPGDLAKHPCTGVMEATVNLARSRANDLARSVREGSDDASWDTYMNGDRTVRGNVERAFVSIETDIELNLKINNRYARNNNLDVFEACEGSKSLPDQCSDYVAAFNVHEEYSDLTDGLANSAITVVFCNYFLAGLPPMRECEYPTATNNMEDQTGAFVHELIHSRSISTSYDVRDGEKAAGGCFGWKCVTNAARSRNSPQGLPEEIADAYELYAYARRAKRCEDEANRNNQPPKQPESGIYCWLKTKCRNGIQCVGQGFANAGLLIGSVATNIGTCGAQTTLD